MTNWNNVTEEDIDKCENSSNYEESLKFLLKHRQERLNAMEAERVKAGNRLMSFITDYFLEMKDYYMEEYGQNWYEVIKEDKIWQIEDKEFDKLIEEYFESVMDI
jgi:hypothetical protein